MADEAEKRRLRREARQKKILSNAGDRLAKFSAPSTGGEEGEEEKETPTLTLDESRIPQFVNTEERGEGGAEDVSVEGEKADTRTETQAENRQTEPVGSELRRRHHTSSGATESTTSTTEPKLDATPTPAPTLNAATAAAQAAHQQDEERKKERTKLAKTRQKYTVGMALFTVVMVMLRLWGGEGTTMEMRRDTLYSLLFEGVAKGAVENMPSIVSMFMYCELALLAKQYLDNPRLFLPTRPPEGEGGNMNGLMSNVEQLGTLWWLLGTVWSDVCVYVCLTLLLLSAPLLWWGLPPQVEEEPYAS
eukprot:comp22740_c0_seq1/m.35455 comp22740_c0_seq1/g.35455  ORF comp22740_c0_seq1/g.35455 comp22740_c0_seq1/m.35455 type:complete len:305 (-) comp22740_c0_seq1:20-934(-)